MQSHEERAEAMLQAAGGSMAVWSQRNALIRMILAEDEVEYLKGDAEMAADRIERLEKLLARAYPFLTWPDEVRGSDPALDADFDGIIADVQVAIQHLPDEKED